MTYLEYFMEQVQMEPNTGCWIWMGYVNNQGYGKFSNDGKEMQAHNYIWEVYNKKEINPDLVRHHKCENILCVNFEHIKEITPKEHTATMKNFMKNKTHCKNGHKFTEDNTILWTDIKTNRTNRRCKECHRIWVANYRYDNRYK